MKICRNDDHTLWKYCCRRFWIPIIVSIVGNHSGCGPGFRQVVTVALELAGSSSEFSASREKAPSRWLLIFQVRAY